MSRHVPDLRRPQAVAAAAWKPRLVTCSACTGLLALPRNSTADRRCDGCGTVTTGVENGDGIFPGLVVVVLMFGLCSDCKYWDGESGAAS